MRRALLLAWFLVLLGGCTSIDPYPGSDGSHGFYYRCEYHEDLYSCPDPWGELHETREAAEKEGERHVAEYFTHKGWVKIVQT